MLGRQHDFLLYLLKLTPHPHPPVPSPSLSPSSSPSLSRFSLHELDKLLSGPEIWHIMPLCWSSLGATPWIWMQCKWYDDSLWGNINFTIIQLFWVQRLTSWDNQVFCHEKMNSAASSTLKQCRGHTNKVQNIKSNVLVIWLNCQIANKHNVWNCWLYILIKIWFYILT